MCVCPEAARTSKARCCATWSCHRPGTDSRRCEAFCYVKNSGPRRLANGRDALPVLRRWGESVDSEAFPRLSSVLKKQLIVLEFQWSTWALDETKHCMMTKKPLKYRYSYTAEGTVLSRSLECSFNIESSARFSMTSLPNLSKSLTSTS